MVGVIRDLRSGRHAGDGAEAAARTRVLPLVFESLVAADPSGGVRPLLAASWERDAAGQRWRFHLRSGVMLHDGSHLQPAQVAAALRARERPWKIGVDSDAVTIDLDRAQPDLPWDLADTRYGIAIRTASGDLVGSGPFRLEPADPRRVSCCARTRTIGPAGRSSMR